jgi:tetratricopeptide (TPR) repeat protein
MSETINPKQLISEAKSAYKRGDYIDAAHAYDAAATSYQIGGDDLTAAEMRNNCSVSYVQAGETELALRAVEGTAEIFAAAGDIRRQGMALGNLGAALEADNRIEEAVETYDQSADLLKQVGEGELRANVMQSLSRLQLSTGRQLEALATMEAGLEGVERPNTQQRFLKKLLKLPYKYMGKS